METFGRYQLLRTLATGGMGQIYLARQQGPVGFEKVLVVKRILPHLAKEAEFIEMFFDEARIAAALNHPNIAQIYELGEVGGDYFIAMEYVHGESIRMVSERAFAQLKGGMPLGLKCRVIADAAAGLDFAHRARTAAGKALGLIHRDVSPHNILVGFNGSVKLIDFGVAKASGKVSHTLTGSIKGKYAYMSPEQARGDELDARSDIFGLGIVFHELLTGNRLFRRDSEPGTLKAVVQAKVPLPSSVVKGLPKAIDAIVLKALAKKREDRYQEAAQLQLALEEAVVELKLPATSAHLGTFMRDLFADVLAQEQRHQTDAAAAPQAPRDEPAKAQKTPSKRRLSFDELADQRTRVAASAVPEPAKPLEVKAKVKERAVPLIFDIGALEARLAAAGPSDRTSGVFFKAVLDAVTRFAGPIAEPAVRSAGEGAGEYQAAFPYPTTEFLRVLWKAGEVVAPMCESADQAFVELGRACLDGLLESVAGRALAGQARPVEPAWMLTSWVAALQALVTPGDRRLEVDGPRAATFSAARELLPAELYAGMLDRAFSRLSPGTEAAFEVERADLDAVVLRVRW